MLNTIQKLVALFTPRVTRSTPLAALDTMLCVEPLDLSIKSVAAKRFLRQNPKAKDTTRE